MVSGEMGRPGLTRRDPRASLTPPEAVVTLLDILPADLADVVRAVAGGFQVDDADAGAGFGYQTYGYFSWLSLLPRRLIIVVDDAGVATGLAGDAGGDAGQGVSRRFWGMSSPHSTHSRADGALRKSRPGVLHAIGDRVVYLVQDRAFVRPACRHW